MLPIIVNMTVTAAPIRLATSMMIPATAPGSRHLQLLHQLAGAAHIHAWMVTES